VLAGVPKGVHDGRRGSVDLRISLEDGHDDNQIAELESLYSWLRSEPELAGYILKEPVSTSLGEMGALSSALIASVGAGGTLPVLAWSLKAWLLRPRGAIVKIRIEGDGGRAVDITADRISRDEVEGLIRQVISEGTAR
jgi:uncharacterized protein (TIGR03382 family)